MTQCTCGAEVIKHDGKMYALHEKRDHYARINRKKPPKPKPKPVSRPRQWTDEEIAEAIKAKDERVLGSLRGAKK